MLRFLMLAQSKYVVKIERWKSEPGTAPGRAWVRRQKAGISETAVQLQEVNSMAERLREFFYPGTCITFKIIWLVY